MIPKGYMNTLATSSHPKRRAFTLIELVLVIAVVAVLMLIGAKFFKQQREQSAIKQTAVDMQQIVQAAQAYYVADTNNYWPTDITKLSGIKRCGTLFLNNGGTCGGFNSYSLSFPAGYAAQGSPNAGTGSNNNPLNPYEPVCPVGQPSLDCYCPKTALNINCLCPDPNYPGHQCTHGAPPSAPVKKASSIIVSTTVATANNAQQLARLLPMAKVEGTKVSITMPAPIETPDDYTFDELMNENEAIEVKSIYTTMIGAKFVSENEKGITGEKRLTQKSSVAEVKLPECPTGWTPGYDAALTQTILNLSTDYQVFTRGVYLCRQNYSFTPNQTGTDLIQVKNDRPTFGAGNNPDYYNAMILVITYCVPPSVINNNLNLKNRFTGYSKMVNGNPDKCYFANFSGSGG